ncbi:hypothetical protein PbJCM17693_21990 [Paenibacillus macerans]|nr:hypothetical protein PbJCM17693_21990 [Paenibacillus macerans]
MMWGLACYSYMLAWVSAFTWTSPAGKAIIRIYPLGVLKNPPEYNKGMQQYRRGVNTDVQEAS